ncbi:MAG: rhodanese-like domain-containing protein [Oligoflexales bacterium]
MMGKMIRRSLIRTLIILPFPLTFSLISFSKKLDDHEKKKIVEAKIQRFENDFSAPQVSVADLMKLLKKDRSEIVIVDVRTKQEQDISMLQGAISSDDFLKNAARYKGKTVVSYCTIGYRSSLFTEKLKRKGIKAFNLRGSLLLWTHSEGKLYDQSGKETRKIHVYGRDWNLVPESYEPEY